jgi:hypothetical protein
MTIADDQFSFLKRWKLFSVSSVLRKNFLNKETFIKNRYRKATW